MRRKIESLPRSVFTHISITYVVASPDATQEEADKIAEEHICSAMTNVSGVTEIDVTVELN